MMFLLGQYTGDTVFIRPTLHLSTAECTVKICMSLTLKFFLLLLSPDSGTFVLKHVLDILLCFSQTSGSVMIH